MKRLAKALYSTVYIVLMQRYGNEEDHHYILGTYTTLERAKKEGEKHKLYRDNKYEPKIIKSDLDNSIYNSE